MAPTDIPQRTVRDTRLQREIERERSEHMMNQDAKVHLSFDDDERHKDARATPLSSKVRR